MSGLKLAGAKFAGADLRGAKMAGADLQQATFAGADLTGADLTQVGVEAADFRRADGLKAEDRERLEGDAKRGEFELKQGADALVTVAYGLVYLVVAAALAGLTVVAYRRNGGRGLWLVCLVVNAAALFPPAFLGLMALFGSSSAAQMNAGPVGLRLWLVWAIFWPVCRAGVPIGLVVLAVGVVVFVARRANRGPLRWEGSASAVRP